VPSIGAAAKARSREHECSARRRSPRFVNYNTLGRPSGRLRLLVGIGLGGRAGRAPATLSSEFVSTPHRPVWLRSTLTIVCVPLGAMLPAHRPSARWPLVRVEGTVRVWRHCPVPRGLLFFSASSRIARFSPASQPAGRSFFARCGVMGHSLRFVGGCHRHRWPLSRAPFGRDSF
jgi:hypothetical protein